MNNYLIGLDLGTTKLCAAAFDPEQNRLLAVEAADNQAGLAGEPEASEQDADRLVTQALELLSKLVRRSEVSKKGPAALGVTGQMHGVVLTDARGQPATPLINWQDQRGNRPCGQTGRSFAEELARRLGPVALEAAGCRPATGYGGVTLLRLAEEGRLPTDVVALTIHDLVVCRLCGRAATDPTDAASWGLFNVRDGAGWLAGVPEALKISPKLLPEILPTGACAGKIGPDAAKVTGLPAGLPVAVALGDNQASFLGSVPQLAGALLMNLGTGGQMSLSMPSFIRIGGLETRPLVKGYWLAVGASLCGGRAYAILETFFRQVGRELLGLQDVPRLYEQMNALAARADKNCGGVKARTLFSGTRRNPDATGGWSGLTETNLTPANLTRAVIRGMVGELAAFYKTAQSEGAEGEILVGAGNAARRNPLVRAELERQIRLPLRLPAFAEEAALGAALAGGVAAGVFPDWESAVRRDIHPV